MSRSAAIVGVGCVSHAGVGFAALRDALREERAAENPAYAPPIADLEALLSDLGYPRPPRASMMALLAAREAVSQAGGADTTTPDELGVIMNRNHGQHQTVERYLSKIWDTGPGSASGLVFVQTIANTVLGLIAMQLSARGPSELYFGPSSMGMGLDLIRAGKAKMILAGSVDETSDFSLATGECWHWDSFIPGEGAVFLALEQPERASKRNQRVLGFLRGCDLRFDRLGRENPAQRDVDSLVTVIKRALQDSEMGAGEIGIVSLSGGAGLQEVDAAEREAVFDVFGEEAELIATKSVLGDAWGAAAGIAALGALDRLSTTRYRSALVLMTDISGQNGAFVLSQTERS